MNNLVQFITAGNALFTLENTATGNRFTFRVRQPGDDKPHFVSVLTGADNESDYTFHGTIFEGLRLSARAAVSDCSYCPEREGDRLASAAVVEESGSSRNRAGVPLREVWPVWSHVDCAGISGHRVWP